MALFNLGKKKEEKKRKLLLVVVEALIIKQKKIAAAVVHHLMQMKHPLLVAVKAVLKFSDQAVKIAMICMKHLKLQSKIWG